MSEYITKKERFGLYLCYLRKQAHLTQMDVADKLEMSQSCISRWEHGESIPAKKYLYRLAHLYHVSKAKIMCEI